jgi:hypothetical protein
VANRRRRSSKRADKYHPAAPPPAINPVVKSAVLQMKVRRFILPSPGEYLDNASLDSDAKAVFFPANVPEIKFYSLDALGSTKKVRICGWAEGRVNFVFLSTRLEIPDGGPIEATNLPNHDFSDMKQAAPTSRRRGLLGSDPRGSKYLTPGFAGYFFSVFLAGATNRASMSALGNSSRPAPRSMMRALPLGVTQMM